LPTLLSLFGRSCAILRTCAYARRGMNGHYYNDQQHTGYREDVAAACVEGMSATEIEATDGKAGDIGSDGCLHMSGRVDERADAGVRTADHRHTVLDAAENRCL